MIHFIRLVRPVNLLIIAVTMVVMRYVIIGHLLYPDYFLNKIPFSTGDIDFLLLLISTVMIAGAGYIINDYFDLRIDRVNKPEKIIVGKYIKKRWAMLTHIVFNCLAVGIGLYLTIRYHTIFPLAVHLFTTTALWLYSLSLKRKFLIGNMMIALLSSLVILLVGWFELPGMNSNSLVLAKNGILIYAGFAFLSTLIREIQKDMADVKGDQVVKCSTVPIVIGMQKTKVLVVFLLLILMLSVVALQQAYLHISFKAELFIFGTVVFPMLLSGYVTWVSNQRRGHILAGNLMKFAMFCAILFAVFLL